MRESVIDVLFYLLDDILDQNDDNKTNVDEMTKSLRAAGFTHEDVDRAIDWFCAFSQIAEQTPVIKMNAMRIFSSTETEIIGREEQDFLLGLLRAGILNHGLLEIVIERALALEEPLDTETLRWVVLMVLNNADIHNDPILSAWREHWLYFDENRKIQ